LKFTYKYSIEIGEMAFREIRSGESSLMRSNFTKGYSINGRRRKRI